MADTLNGMTVVITGGSSGIGLECARMFGRKGARVYLLARSENKLQEAVAALQSAGGEYHTVSCDVTDPHSVDRAVDRIAQESGKIDILLLSHGVMHLRPVEHLPLSDFEQMMRTNYLGNVVAIKAFLPLLRRGAKKRIVILSSLAAKVAPPFFSAYSASKSAVTAFVHALRQELRPEKIKVTLVHPGPVQTPLIDGYIHGPYYRLPPGVPIVSPERVAARIVKTALGRAQREVYVPGRFKVVSWLASILPGAVDLTYSGAAKQRKGQ